MFKPGDRVRIRTEDKSRKVWGRVINVVSDTEMIDVTLGPEAAAAMGIPLPAWREFMPGKTSVRIEIELEI